MEEPPLSAPSDPSQVLSISQLNELVRSLLEEAFPSVWIAGEVSNLARPASGHIYFTLKDARAQVRCVMFRGKSAPLKFDLTDGLEVLAFGQASLYAVRGDYQLIIGQLEPKGVGALELAFRQRCQKLAAEGLFDKERKRPLPRFPRRIAFVTSPTGAAIRDFLEVLRRRFPGTDVLIVPSRVQGDGAAEEIARGVDFVSRHADELGVEVLVVGRGGGSLEDLWAFNEEVVARAIYASRVPVVSAVGHEIDVTIADFVADVRALTPSEAAELVTPSRDGLLGGLAQIQRRLASSLKSHARHARSRYERVAARRAFQHPYDRLHDESQRLDDLQARLERAARQRLTARRTRLAELAGKLEALSPLGVLARGYSLTHRADGSLVRRSTDVQPGDELRTRLASGEVVSRVERLLGADEPPRDAEQQPRDAASPGESERVSEKNGDDLA